MPLEKGKDERLFESCQRYDVPDEGECKVKKTKKVGTVTHGVNGSMCRMSLSRQETVQKNRKVEADGRANLWF